MFLDINATIVKIGGFLVLIVMFQEYAQNVILLDGILRKKPKNLNSLNY
jgi:hypothetical protein